jgi:hypothetical protein
MSEPASRFILKWHPFTPAGVAGAAGAPRWQLWLGLGVSGGLAIATLLWFLTHCWAPVIVEAIERLEDGGVIRQGVFQPGGSVTEVTLAANRHLEIALNWDVSAPRDQASDVRVLLQIDRVLVCSLFGCSGFSYERLGDRPVGRTETGAWWRAWRSTCYTGAALGLAFFLIVAWWFLTVVYAWVIRLFAFYLDRQVDFGGAARVAQASLIPGALWLTAAMFFHAHGWLDLLGLLSVFVMHVPVGWLYAGLACRRLPMRPDSLPANPFQPMDGLPSSDAANPFKGGSE